MLPEGVALNRKLFLDKEVEVHPVRPQVLLSIQDHPKFHYIWILEPIITIESRISLMNKCRLCYFMFLLKEFAKVL